MPSNILLLERFLDRGDCARLVNQYQAALLTRKLTPHGTLVTDVPLSTVDDVINSTRCCGPAPLDLRGLRNGLCTRLAEFFDLPGLVPDYSAYTRVNVGGAHELHADAVELHGGPNHTPWRACTAVIYLNDRFKDFDGGALFFPEWSQQVSPKAGQCVCFTSGLDNRHEVTKVTRGRRDALAFWFTQDEGHRETWPA